MPGIPEPQDVERANRFGFTFSFLLHCKNTNWSRGITNIYIINMLRRIIVTAFVALICALSASAYDVITTTDNSTIKAIVTEITPTSVKYRKASNPKGPVYTVEIEKVKTITYTNGTKDVFNQEEKKPAEPIEVEKPETQTIENKSPQAATPQNPTMTDAELLQLYTLNTDNYENYSDNKNLNLAVEIQKYDNMAKKYKKLAWIGGGAMVGVGVILTGMGFSYVFNDTNDEACIAIGSVGAVLMGTGLGWCIGWNIKAHNAAKKAKEFRSMALFEGNIFDSNKQKLAYGVNLFSDNVHRTKALGLSLSYSF